MSQRSAGMANLEGARAGARLPRANLWRGKLEIEKCGKLRSWQTRDTRARGKLEAFQT